jgi:glutathione S-transferase
MTPAPTEPLLTLYILKGCPFCAKVLMAGAELGIDFDEREISDPQVSEELIARGGKHQVPYLIDTENDVALYGSDEIVDYLHKRFSGEPVS